MDHRRKKTKASFRINGHLIFAAAFLIIVALIVWRFLNYGTRIDPNDYESHEYVADVMDIIVPFIKTDEQKAKDDGITTIVTLGNAPFADDRDSEDNLANMIAREADAVVYNCAIKGSYLAAEGDSIAYAPSDASNFYWLVYNMCYPEDLKELYAETFRDYGDELPMDTLSCYQTLTTLDFDTVDVIAIMYDASDYLAGHPVYNPDNLTDISQVAGNLAAGLEMIQNTYPHIRIIVMSPTFAYAVNEDGEYVNSETYRYGDSPLSSYMSMEGAMADIHGVTFLDNLYGTIHEGIADDYLTDNLHLNLEGRKLVCQRFLYALNYYNKNSDK